MARLRRLIRSEAGRLALVMAIFCVAAVSYNVATPIFEAPDEQAHFQVALWLKQTGTLPRIPADLPQVSHEIGQPPLYYALVALAILPIDTSDADRVAPANPHWAAGGGRMVHYHDAREDFPYRATTLAVHLARLVSTLLGLVTLFFVYRLARCLLPRGALLATALVAFNPQFAFMSATINNDSLITAMATLALYGAVFVLVAQKREGGWYLLLGGAWGVATLAKLGGLGLGAVFGLLLLLQGVRERAVRRPDVLLRGAWLVAGFLLVAGWWFWRNWSLYGDPLAWNELLLVNQNLLRAQPLTLLEAVGVSTFLKRSFWMLFGYGILGPEPFYVGVDLLLIVSAAGLVLTLGARRRPSWTAQQQGALLLLVAWMLIFYLLLLRWMRLTEASNVGRLYMPAVGPLALLLALGLRAYRGRGRWLQRGALLFLASWSLLGPLLVIQPAFATPQPLAAAAPLPNPVQIEIDAGMALLGFSMETDRWRPGAEVAFDLFWQAREGLTESYVLAPRLLDSENRVVAAYDTIPSTGRYPTPMWVPDVRFAEHHVLPPIAADAAPGAARLVLYVYPFGAPDMAPALIVDGQPAGWPITLAGGKISPPPAGDPPPGPPLATFGAVGSLLTADVAAQTTDALTVRLTWRADQPDGVEYQVFAHLVDAAGQLVAQADGPPRQGAFPTSIWDSGDLIREERTFLFPEPGSLAPGAYRVFVGLYRLADSTRLPAARPDGSPWPNDQAAVLAFTVP